MNPLVTPDWLQARSTLHTHLDDLIILDATLPPVGVTPATDVHARYLAQHIPGALFFDIEALSDHTTPLPHMLPTPEGFGASMSALGIFNTATVVVYEQAPVFSAPRAWWMLRTLGARDVRLLDGGLPAWLEAGLSTESGPVQRPPATFHAALQSNAVVDFTQLQQVLATNSQILDARSAGRFNGTAPEPRPGLSSGHMPGATSLPSTELAQKGRLKPVAELQALFAARNLDLTQPITTTCGSGVTAAVLALGLELSGATQIRLYDGSWAEYAQHPDAVIAKVD